MGDNTDHKGTPSTVTTTITTTDPGNGFFILANMLQNELDRKLADLKDIREAYSGIMAKWTELKSPFPKDRCLIVQVCWTRSAQTWHYQLQLEDAARLVEAEISKFRKEILDAMVTHARAGPSPPPPFQ
ncbi:hypothetical protein BGX24_002700 [Mortierella sp. AD032]|nr:hypothetical protein BGX24_002700 [Mortierella sp. AD032]